MRPLAARFGCAGVIALMAALPLAAQAPPAPSPSPMGWAVHSIGVDSNWEVDRWLPLAQQSGAGWVRDPVYFETYVYPDNPNGTYIPIAGSHPARWMDPDGIADYANEAAKILEGGFRLVLSTWASMDPGDENTAGPVMLALLDQLRVRLGSNASVYMNRLAIEHFSEPNIYAAGRPDIHVEPLRYVEIAAELYTAVKSRAEYRQIPIFVGATAHFGLDYACGFGWQNGPVGVPSDAPPRCARYASAPYNTATEFGLGWLTQILELGVIDYADGFSAHPYRGTSAPEQGFTLIPTTDPEGFINEIRMWVNRIEQFNTRHKTLDYQFTEIGYPSAPATFGAGSEQRQADYLTRLWTMLLHESLLAQGKRDRGEAGGYLMSAFHYNTLKDDCIPSGPFATPPCGITVPDIEKTGGLLTWDLQAKTGFRYFTQLTSELRVDDLEAVDQAGVSVSAGVPVYTRLFKRKDGTGWVLAAWTGTADPVAAGVNISLALDRNYLQVRRTTLDAGGSATVDMPFVRAGNAIFLPNVQLLNRVSFFKIRTAQPTPNDFDGDGKTDVAVWRPSDGTWRWLTSSSGYDLSKAQVRQWGHSGDVPISGDFDGDGIADLAIWRPCDGFVPPCGARWYWLTSSTGYSYNAQNSVQWGAPTDVPVAADYDGDGRTDIAVWRPSTGVWYVLNSVSNYDYRFQWGRQWGAPTDVPVPADYDGDGRMDLAVWRPGTGVWYWLTSSSGYLGAHGVEWGTQGDAPIGHDYDNDGYADLVIWRGADAIWYILWSSTGYLYGSGLFQGANGDRPQVGNFDHDGQVDLALYTASTNLWTIFQTSGNPWTVTWGASGDIPLIRR